VNFDIHTNLCSYIILDTYSNYLLILLIEICQLIEGVLEKRTINAFS